MPTPDAPKSYAEWHSWALARFDADQNRSFLAARAAVEAQDVGADAPAALRAALSAASAEPDIVPFAAPAGPGPVEAGTAQKPMTRWWWILGVYQVVMGMYLGALVLLFFDKPVCTAIDAPCDPSLYTVFITPTVGQLDLLLISINIGAGVLLIVRKRWILGPILMLQLVNVAAIVISPVPSAYSLVFTLGFVLPLGWIATITVVAIQLGARTARLMSDARVASDGGET